MKAPLFGLFYFLFPLYLLLLFAIVIIILNQNKL